MKVLLISANTTKIPYPVSPLGLDYVLAAVSIHHEVKITDMVEHRDLESLGELVRNFSPDLIGISFRNIDNLDTLEPAGFIEHYRQLTGAVRFTSQAPIVLGGSGFTIFPQELLNALGADFGIVGEGERFGLLVDALERNEDPMRIPGVVTPKSPVVLPEPWTGPFSRIIEAGSPYFRYYLERGGMLGLQTKRGCPFECLYCTYPSIEGKSVRVAPPHRVAEEARLLQDCGAKYLYITDSVFNADYSHSLEIAKAFVRARISIPWGGFFTPTNHPPDYYKRLAEACLTHVEFGTESLSDSVLANYKKPFRTTDIFHAHKSCCEAGLHVLHYLLLGGPGEDERTLNETLFNQEKLRKTVFLVFCGIRIFPGTELCRIALKEGKISPSQSLLEPVFYLSPAFSKERLLERIEDSSAGRFNRVMGTRGKKISRLVSKMYSQGRYGPLWENLIQ